MFCFYKRNYFYFFCFCYRNKGAEINQSPTSNQDMIHNPLLHNGNDVENRTAIIIIIAMASFAAFLILCALVYYFVSKRNYNKVPTREA
jgi:hypothetical protein